jgi:putative transposase
VGRFFPSRKTCHCCGWKWEDMTLKDRVFVCQNPSCPYYQFPQDRDHNAGQNVLREALRQDPGSEIKSPPVLARTMA